MFNGNPSNPHAITSEKKMLVSLFVHNFYYTHWNFSITGRRVSKQANPYLQKRANIVQGRVHIRLRLRKFPRIVFRPESGVFRGFGLKSLPKGHE